MDMKNNKLSILTNGIIKENPILVLILGTCPFQIGRAHV